MRSRGCCFERLVECGGGVMYGNLYRHGEDGSTCMVAGIMGSWWQVVRL